jgi:hypothetical protein
MPTSCLKVNKKEKGQEIKLTGTCGSQIKSNQIKSGSANHKPSLSSTVLVMKTSREEASYGARKIY